MIQVRLRDIYDRHKHPPCFHNGNNAVAQTRGECGAREREREGTGYLLHASSRCFMTIMADTYANDPQGGRAIDKRHYTEVARLHKITFCLFAEAIGFLTTPLDFVAQQIEKYGNEFVPFGIWVPSLSLCQANACLTSNSNAYVCCVSQFAVVDFHAIY